MRTGRKDARKLSEVSCRIDLPSVHVPSDLSRRLKSACGNREELVECRTKLINNVRGWLRTQLWRIRTGGTDTFASRVRSHATEQNPLPEYDADDIGYVDGAGPARKRSKIPPRLRRKVLARDGHRCRVPGCRSTNIDVHQRHQLAFGGSHDEANLITLCEGHHVAVHDGKLVIRGMAPDFVFEFATIEEPSNRFAAEARAVETEKALEQLGFKRHEARAAVRAARTHVGTSDQPIEAWLKTALEECRTPT